MGSADRRPGTSPPGAEPAALGNSHPVSFVKLEKPRRFKMPDILARLRANFGDKVYDADELQSLIQDSRGDRS